MKKNLKRIAAIAALAAIVIFFAAFIISAFFADAGNLGNRFMALLVCIIAIPMLVWLLLFCIGRMQNKHTIAEFFPEDKDNTADK